MKTTHITFIILNILCMSCAFSIQNGVQLLQKCETIIPTEIIGNYFHKYFKSAEVFLSISHKSLNIRQKDCQQNLIKNLLMSPKLDNFSYSIFDKISRPKDNRQIIHLILIDRGDLLL